MDTMRQIILSIIWIERLSSFRVLPLYRWCIECPLFRGSTVFISVCDMFRDLDKALTSSEDESVPSTVSHTADVAEVFVQSQYLLTTVEIP